jgi:dimethylargininase
LTAITRTPSAALDRCELTHLAREPIDLAAARRQHEAYEAVLAGLGCTVLRLAEEPDLPDAVFVEDTVVVLDEVAIVTRPGAASRRAESGRVAVALSRWRPLAAIEWPGTLDGGDVLAVGRTLFVGRSTRTNEAGIAQLEAIAAPAGYRVQPVAVRGCLHLKTAVSAIAEDALLMNRAWLDPSAFAGFDIVDVDRAEPFAANVLRVGAALVHPAAFGRTRARLERRGLEVHAVDVSELAKAEGGVTCCVVLVQT